MFSFVDIKFYKILHLFILYSNFYYFRILAIFVAVLFRVI